MPDASGQPTADELIRQKLAQALAQGAISKPGQAALGGTVPPAPAPPTITPTTPQGTEQKSPQTGTVPQAKPFQADEDWAKANPGAAPAKPVPYQPEGTASRLARALAFGAMEFGRPGEGAKAAGQYVQEEQGGKQAYKTAQQQFPQTLHTARGTEELRQANLAEKEATTAEAVKRTSLMGTDPNPKTARERMEEDFRQATLKGDTNGANVQLDMMKRAYPKDFQEDDAKEMAKIPPQVMAQSGTKPVTPVWGPPGAAQITYPSTQEAQAAWGAKVAELSAKPPAATPEEQLKQQIMDAQKKGDHAAVAVLQQQLEGLNPGAVAQRAATEEDRKIREQAAAGTAQDKQFEQRQKDLKPYQEKIDSAASAADYVKNGTYTGPGDEALMLQFFNTVKPATGFRLTQTEQKMLLEAQSWMNSFAAKKAHIMGGTWMSDEQRRQIADTMNSFGARAQQEIDKYDKAATERHAAPGAPHAGAAKPAAAAKPSFADWDKANPAPAAP